MRSRRWPSIVQAARLVCDAASSCTRRQLMTSSFSDVARSRPRRIILVRHGQSLGNVSEATYVDTADWQISLSNKGVDQAKQSGIELKKLIQDENVFFYCSPYLRTKQTCEHIKAAFNPRQVLGHKEEPRIAEQQFGNFQNLEEMQGAKKERNFFGRFFYRFPNGESGLDVYNRVSSFISTIFRDNNARREVFDDLSSYNIVIVTHGLTLRLFLMRWFHLSVDCFEKMYNPGNAEFVIMEPKDLSKRANTVRSESSESINGERAEEEEEEEEAAKLSEVHGAHTPSVSGSFETWMVKNNAATQRIGGLHRIYSV